MKYALNSCLGAKLPNMGQSEVYVRELLSMGQSKVYVRGFKLIIILVKCFKHC
jgi:hypothetical protein